MANNITIKQLADELGLSRNTVSLALQNDLRVAAKTLQRVLSYAISVGYYRALPGTADITEPQEEAPIQILVLRRPDQTAYWQRII